MSRGCPLTKKYDYLIVGTGLFGAIFAREITDNGKKCLCLDKRSHIGGNAYTENIAGINVHKYGAHIFHTSDEIVWKYVNRFSEFNNYVNSPIAVYRGNLYNLPFNMNTFNKLWNVKTPNEAKAIIEKQRKESGITDPKNLEEQALALVGKDIFKKLIKGYTEKQWGRKCSELPAFIIKRLPLRFVFDNNFFNDRYQGIPIGGYTQMISRILDGIKIELNTNYFDFIRNNPKIANKIVYTGTIDEFYDYQFGELEYRSLRFETDTLDTDNFQGNAVVNYTERKVPYTRIIEHKHFEFGTQNQTVITREYSRRWKRGIEPYYPINDVRNNSVYKKYSELAESDRNVIFGGRLGHYKYYDMDQVIKSALDTAKKELSK
jgi:UDP-galactopyranose mutase